MRWTPLAHHRRPSGARRLERETGLVRASRVVLALMEPIEIAALILVTRFVFRARPRPGDVAILIVAAVGVGIQSIVGGFWIRCYRPPALDGEAGLVRVSRTGIALMVLIGIAALILVARFVLHGRPSPGDVAVLIVAALVGIQSIVGGVRIWRNRPRADK